MKISKNLNFKSKITAIINSLLFSQPHLLNKQETPNSTLCISLDCDQS